MQIKTLKNEIIKANNAYRNGESIISDSEYDSLLEDLEAELDFIEFADFKQSLTEAKGTVTNSYVLGSLSKFKYEEPEKLLKWLKEQNIKTLFCSDKIDGCSFYAEYRNGKLTFLSSRGDGAEGTDWTNKAKYINIPQTIPTTDAIDIRGEVTLLNDDYLTLGFINKRNGTAGIMNAKDVEPERLKYIHAIAYEVLSECKDITIQFSLLNALGFNIASYSFFTMNDAICEDLKSYYMDRKSRAPYAMDGLVLSDPSYSPENEFLPKGKVAFKINSTGVAATIIGIEENMSKGGLNKPTLIISPIVIDGRTINKVTGNNWKYLIDNGQGVGAEVMVIFSGEIIPKIVKVNKTAVPVLPVVCPSCGTDLGWKGVDLVCCNKQCGDMLIQSLASFLNKSGVEGVTATSLQNWNVYTIQDLLSFVSDGSKSQDNFVKEIKKNILSKTQEDLFSCMTFDGAGRTNITKILDYYGEGNLVTATRVLKSATDLFFEKKGYPEGIGQKVIDKIKNDWNSNLRKVMLIISDHRWKPVTKAVEVVNTNSAISGKSFCITGTLSKGRKEFEKIVIDNGGTLSSVSKKLDFLLVGVDAGSKEDKAKSLGVTIINEEEFLGMI